MTTTKETLSNSNPLSKTQFKIPKIKEKINKTNRYLKKDK